MKKSLTKRHLYLTVYLLVESLRVFSNYLKCWLTIILIYYWSAKIKIIITNLFATYILLLLQKLILVVTFKKNYFNYFVITSTNSIVWKFVTDRIVENLSEGTCTARSKSTLPGWRGAQQGNGGIGQKYNQLILSCFHNIKPTLIFTLGFRFSLFTVYYVALCWVGCFIFG